MKKLWIFLALFFLSTLFGYTDPEPGRYAVSAEWLYMLNSIDQPYFVLDSSEVSVFIGENKANDQSWHSGYRVEGKHRFCNCDNDFLVRWTHFPEFSDSRTISGQNLSTIFTPAEKGSNLFSDETRLSQKTQLYYLDLLFGQKVVDRCRFHFALQGGVQYAHIDFKEDQTYVTNPERNVATRSRLWGIGPEIGAEFSYCLSDCLTVVGRASTAMLASKREAYLETSASNVLFDVKNEEYWRFIPASDLRFGLSYEKPMSFRNCFGCCLGDYIFDLEVGYEFITYYNGIERMLFYDGAAASGASFNEMMNLTLHGPYVHLGVKF